MKYKIFIAGIFTFWISTAIWAMPIDEPGLIKDANEELKVAYEEALSSFGDTPGAVEKLKQAQRDWIKFRESECKLVRSVWDDPYCDSKMINERTDKLKKLNEDHKKLTEDRKKWDK